MATVLIIGLAYDLPFMQDARWSGALDSTYMLWMFVLTWPLIALAILGTGWIEDLAAKRRPRLWPNGVKKRAHSRWAGLCGRWGWGRLGHERPVTAGPRGDPDR
ncbi:hypothetical protein ACFRAI_23160 [Streptomyces sp. NPDC056637]|uniref:hypothetical protein n=2 Tax=unclassified Streptomyces TaxID=2593676 RepID=UPI003627CF94